MADYLLGYYNGNFEWSIRPIIPMGRALDKINENDYEEKEDFLYYYLKLLEYAYNKYGYKKISNPFFPVDLNYFSCGALSTTCTNFWLLPNKKIVTCIESLDINTEVGVSDSDGINFFDEFDDPLYKMCKKKFVECRDCIAYRFCRGGCPVRHLEMSRNPNNMSTWECQMVNRFWHYLLNEILVKRKTCFGWKLIPCDELKDDLIVYRLVKE